MEECLCRLAKSQILSEKISRRATALVETLAHRDLTEKVNRRPDSMPHIAYLRFRFLRRQFEGGAGSTLVLPAAVSTGRSLVKKWKALRGEDR